MDTDSAYMVLSTDTLEEVVKPHLRQKYILEKNDWLPRDDTPEHAAYDKRTPGLFKEEYRGDGIVALCSKTYYCFGVEDKVSCKGINKCLNDIHKGTYMDVLLLCTLLCCPLFYVYAVVFLAVVCSLVFSNSSMYKIK
jgi:hypothetical protein